MAEIDYAFIADFAKVEGNATLTAVGGSWTIVAVPKFPTAHRFSVAGRVRARVEEDDIPLRITVSTPEDQVSFSADGRLVPDANQRPYGDGLVGHLFAADMQIVLPIPGLYQVVIDVGNGTSVRRLAFEAGHPSDL